MENLIIFVSIVSMLILTISAFLLLISFKYEESDCKDYKIYEYSEEEDLDFLSEEDLKQLEEDYINGIKNLNYNKNIDFNKVYEINTVYSVRDRQQKIDNILQ